MAIFKRILGIIIILALVAGTSAPFLGNSWPVAAQEDEDGLTCATPEPSGGSYMLHQSSEGVALGPHSGQDAVPPPASPGIGITFDGFNFDDNSAETGGWLFIPPDPIGAAGTDRLIAVVNVMIEARDKTGTLLWRDSLKDFFTTLTPANWLFDPKIVYDQYENRFLVVALEKVDAGTNPDPGNQSRILLAISKTATPATATSADWYYTAINSEESIGGYDCRVDYPGFEVDEEAVYITSNMYEHTPRSGYVGSRLWIVDKGVSAGFYGGSAASVTKHDPYASAGIAMTTMPAQVYGAGGIDGGGSGGTYLVGYDGLTTGGPGGTEAVQVVRVDNPLGATAFTQTYVLVGDIEDIGGIYGWPDLPDAPQLGSATDIEVNDREALDAVWRNNQLWFTTTINPNSGPDAGQTTAHWFRLDTSAWPPTVGEQGDIGGEDIATATYTFFPSLAVNSNGDAKFGFCASAATIYAGAYATVHLSGDASGTVQASETVRAGLDYYVRTFGTGRNRWGDYTGAALDPTDDNVVWLFNQYAMTRGSGTPPEDGRWGTAWASNLFTTAIGAPTVTTNAASSVEETTATLNGNITDTGGENCDSRGFVWGDESHTDPGNTAPASSGYDFNFSQSGNYGTGTFGHGISTDEGTKYYYRACAHNSAGWSYGSELTFLTKPDAPTSFNASTVNSTQIDLSWIKGDGAQQTKIQRKQDSYPTDRNDGTQVYFDTGNITSDTGLNSSMTYYYRAWSYVEGSEQWSDSYAQDFATTKSGITPPIATTNAATLVEETTATLNGVVSVDGGEACQYRFQYGTSPGVYGTNTTWTGNKTTGQSFNESITNLSKGTKYYFRAQAKNSAGTGSGSELAFLTKPDAPTIFNASTVNSTQIDLSWGKGDGAQQTKIQRKQGSYPTDRNDGTQVYFDTGNITSDTGLNASTNYYYRAWSYVEGSEQWSDDYAEDWAMTESPLNNPPSAPSNPSPTDHATGVSINADLSWTGGDPDAGDAVTYDVYLGTNSTPPFKESIGPYAANQTSLSYTLDTLASNTTYYWRIVAKDSYNATTEGPEWKFTTGLPLTSYNITLAADWNLVSLPLIPDNTDITDVTASINDTLAIVWSWNAEEQAWYWYVPGNPLSTLTTMGDGFGYWFFMYGPAILEVSGQEMPDPPTITPAYDVFEEWNLIGFTSATSMSPESYLASIAGNYSIVWDWNAEEQAWLWYVPDNFLSTLTTMEPGFGFWLWGTAKGTLMPPT